MPETVVTTPGGVDPQSSCPVCGEPLAAGSRRCKSCGSLRSWTALCESCGTPVPANATVCHECGRYPRSGRPCAHCGLPLPPTARSCQGCGALQWGRGMLFLSQSTLGLLVVLISSITSLVAVVHSFEVFADSETKLSFSAADSAEVKAELGDAPRITLLATNRGNRSSGIASGSLSIVRRRLGKALEMPLLVVDPAADQRVIEPGGSMAVTFGLRSWYPPDYGIATRTDAAFAALLCSKKQLFVLVSEYGGERTRPVDVPDQALQDLLCAAAIVPKDEPPNSDFCAQRAPCKART